VIHQRDIVPLLTRSRPAFLAPPPERTIDPERDVAAIVAATRDGASDPDGFARGLGRPRHRRVAVFATATAAVAAAVVAAVVGLTVVPADRATDSRRGAATPAGTGVAPLDHGPLLLAAAERVGPDPTTGRYRVLRSESGFAVPVETAGGRYVMFQRTLSTYWLARTGNTDPSWVMSQSLGAVAATPDDEAAWRAAGSPTRMRVTAPKPMDLSTAPGTVHGNTVDRDTLFGVGNKSLSGADPAALPTDPAALRTLILAGFTGGGGDEPTDRDQWLLGALASLVTETPVTAATRAAAFRLLASLPGVRRLGAVTDLRGRAGQAVAFTQDLPTIGSFEVRLIIDPVTGAALAQERRAVQPTGQRGFLAPGAISTYHLVVESTTTDDSPPRPDVVN
jgi:hypothetical protein